MAAATGPPRLAALEAAIVEVAVVTRAEEAVIIMAGVTTVILEVVGVIMVVVEATQEAVEGILEEIPEAMEAILERTEVVPVERILAEEIQAMGLQVQTVVLGMPILHRDQVEEALALILHHPLVVAVLAAQEATTEAMVSLLPDLLTT